MYIKRDLEKDVITGARYFPVVAILGPRQSGKTTLAKKIFADHEYVSLEDPDMRTAALTDPRSFLALHHAKQGLIIDEFQHAPKLLSYIQTIVDAEQKQGYYILTGSQNFLMNQSISQSLAGRVSLHTLLPLSIHELDTHGILPDAIESVLYKGLYPAAYTKKTPPTSLYSQYVRTYLERDVRQLTQVGDLSTFRTFLVLCAERVGQLVNFTEIGRECRISDQTVRRWLSILEASYIIFLLRPYEKTVGKQMVKSPKLFFYDPGLACHLLKITKKELLTNPKRGGLFESLIISDIAKRLYAQGKEPSLYFWQDKQKREVDCIIKQGATLTGLEIKASRTASPSFFSNLTYWKQLVKDKKTKTFVIYGENKKRVVGYKNLLSWQSLDKIL